MENKPTQKEIGKRIAELRKRKGLSQEELARLIGMSRPSLAQIEVGNRTLAILELLDLSHVLGFSLDEIMAVDYTLQTIEEEDVKMVKVVERISEPTLQVSKLKQVLLYILERCAGKPNVGETVLYKLLYFADFNYYELYESHLTGTVYRKLPFGPVPLRIDAIIEQMILDGTLQRVKTEYHGYPQTRYLPLEKADLTQLKASEKVVLDSVIAQMSDWSASALSEYSHKDLPWEVTEDGKEINYELAFYRELPYSVRVYDENEPV